MCTKKKYVQLGDTDLWVPDEVAADGRTKKEVLMCKQKCLEQYVAKVNFESAHSDECRALSNTIWQGNYYLKILNFMEFQRFCWFKTTLRSLLNGKLATRISTCFPRKHGPKPEQIEKIK